MSASIVISCPKCKQQIKAPAEARGKKVKCKACGEIFAVNLPAEPPAKKKTAKAPAEPPKRAAPVYDDEFDNPNPYDVTELDLSSRCPHCAGEMESAEAIVCLHCGYNTHTRQKGETIKLINHTFADWVVWLGPALLCVLAQFVLLGVHLYLWLAYAKVTTLPVLPLEYTQTAIISTESAAKEVDGMLWARIWGSVIAALIMYILGRIAFKRLVLNLTPPPKYKKT
jgi:hypothetical protein